MVHDKPAPAYHWTVESAPTKTGPWRFKRSMHGLGYSAAASAAVNHDRAIDTWIRIIPDGNVKAALLIAPIDV